MQQCALFRICIANITETVASLNVIHGVCNKREVQMPKAVFFVKFAVNIEVYNSCFISFTVLVTHTEV